MPVPVNFSDGKLLLGLCIIFSCQLIYFIPIGKITLDKYLPNHNLNEISDFDKQIKKYLTNDDYLAISGWQSKIYLETGTLQATKMSHSERLFISPKQRDYYVQSYLADLMENRPKVFIETFNGDNPNSIIDSSWRFEIIPEIKDYINSNYKEIFWYGNDRLFLRKDLFAEKND